MTSQKSETIKFDKMHGLGNDFIMLENPDGPEAKLPGLAKKLCDRHQGIGADGIILILPSEKADIRMKIINSDGSEADMCGNGIRCFAKYVYKKKIIEKTIFKIETPAGIMIPELFIENGIVTAVKVNMGAPEFKRSAIPMNGNDIDALDYEISVQDQRIKATSLLMGVPHTMIFVDDVETTDIAEIGGSIEKHPDFPKGTNVNFIEVINENEIKIRTWERGAGQTLACGTGSCASVVASSLNNKTSKNVTVHLKLGDLFIEWKDDVVYMTGPATYVYSGEIEI
jgi:diaminopimelate epimerase